MEQKQKRKLLKNIQNEVKEFHPILEKLFKKLPGIADFQNTHGAFEKGADFILRKYDETLRKEQYIGVIAKLGSLKLNMSDVERQIDECSMRRYRFDGKQEIHLTGIWIALTGSISENAKGKIYEKFKSKYIDFLDDQLLVSLIDEYLPDFWYQIPVHISSLLQDIREAVNNEDSLFNIVDLPNKDFYIKPDLEMYEWSLDNQSLPSRLKNNKNLNILEELRSNKFILLSGQMGGGKSKMLRKLALDLTSPENFLEYKIIPIHTSYKEFSEKFSSDIRNLLNSYISEKAASQFDDNVTFAILIDGLDEAFILEDDQVKELEALHEQVKTEDSIRVIVSTREASIFEDKSIITGNFECLEIRPLKFGQLIKFLNELCSAMDSPGRIIEDLRNSTLLQDLPRSPIAAMILAKLLSQGRHDLPQNLTDLYAQFLELALGRWDIKKGIISQNEYEIAESVILELSKYMIDNQITSIAEDELRYRLDSYLRERNIDITASTVFEKLTHRTGVLVYNRINKTYSFRHRSFGEFFYAKLHRSRNPLEISEKAFSLYWNNIYFFYLGMLKDAPSELEALASLKVEGFSKNFFKILFMGNYFLAAHATPYRVVQNHLSNLFIEIAKLLIESGESNPSIPIFKNSSTMFVIWLLQVLLRNHYGYDYYTKAIEEAAVRVQASEIEYLAKQYTLYFLAVVGLELGTSEPLSLLCDNSAALPTPLQLALSHAMEDFANDSKLLKKIDKRLRRSLKANKEAKNLVKKLYDSPKIQLI